MRSATRTFAGAFALGVVGLVVVGSLDERSLAFTLGVAPTTPVAELRPGDTVCQRPIDVAAAFQEIRLASAGPVAAAPPIDVEVRDAHSGRLLARGVSDTGGGKVGGVVRPKEVRARVGTVSEGERVAVCLSTEGPRPALVFGNAAAAARGSRAFSNGHPLESDITLIFERAESRSLLSLAPDVIDRAARFHGSLSAPWLLWMLAALLITALPALLVVALRDVADDGDQARE